MPPPVPDATTEQRLAALEELLARVIERARQHPAGRRILAYLGLT